MSDPDHEGKEDEEVEFASGQNELCGCIQKTKSEWLDLLSPECEVLELVSKQECPFKNFLQTVQSRTILELIWMKKSKPHRRRPCIVGRGGGVTSRDEEESFQKVNNVKTISDDSIRPRSGNPMAMYVVIFRQARKNCRQIQRSVIKGDRSRKKVKLCAIINPQRGYSDSTAWGRFRI